MFRYTFATVIVVVAASDRVLDLYCELWIVSPNGVATKAEEGLIS
jgi:hypothetical protein